MKYQQTIIDLHTGRFFMRASETLCYVGFNGNRNALEENLEQRKGREGSCITWYGINDKTHKAEICIKGYRSDLIQELKALEIPRDEIDLYGEKYD